MIGRRGSLPIRAMLAGLAGLLAAVVAMGVGQLVTAFVHPRASPVAAVGAALIDVVPGPVREFGIRTFGSYDKPVLIAGICLVLAGIAVLLGVLATRRARLGMAAVALLGIVGAAAAATRPGATWAWALPSLLGAAAGAWALMALARRLPSARPAPPAAEDGPAAAAGAPAYGRRRFLLTGLGAAVAAGATGGVGRLLTGARQAVASSRAALRLPPPDSPAHPVPSGADLDVPHVPAFFTPNERFYRVDTVLRLPSVPREEWTLRVHGMVDRELELSFDDLLSRRIVQRDITLACVSNPVGGPYVGNARWLGVRLADVLREAGVHTEADEILSRSADGWTCGTPTATVMDGRDALLAFGMNGEPLPVAHGFPVRMVVPGLYGYVSATKWVDDIELTRFARKRPYWAKHGWALRGPVKTMARIDTPHDSPRAGRVPVAGVAWAQHRGIQRVEVRVDDGPWHDAELAPVPSKDTWRGWVHYWDATPGQHRLQARATDGRGRTQTRRRVPTVPNGASGWHTVHVTVD